jgi:hypothetical protein
MYLRNSFAVFSSPFTLHSSQKIKLMESKKIKLIEFKPNGVSIQYLDSGKKVRISRSFFKKQIDAGNFELVNPKAMPAVL